MYNPSLPFTPQSHFSHSFTLLHFSWLSLLYHNFIAPHLTPTHRSKFKISVIHIPIPSFPSPTLFLLTRMHGNRNGPGEARDFSRIFIQNIVSILVNYFLIVIACCSRITFYKFMFHSERLCLVWIVAPFTGLQPGHRRAAIQLVSEDRTLHQLTFFPQSFPYILIKRQQSFPCTNLAL